MFQVYGVTYVPTTNYGSCLQAYALKTAIGKMTVGDGEPVSYRQIPLTDCPGYYPPSKNVKTVLVRLVKNNYLKRPFLRFEKRNMVFTAVYPIDQLDELNRTADAYVCGSDVIWNTDFNKNCKAFYLDFASRYRFSYAASFGKGVLNEKDEAMARRYLPELDAISVREKTSAEHAKRFTEKPVEVVADPVLLLAREDWISVAKKPKREHFIFVYSTTNSKLAAVIDQIAERLHETTGFPIVHVDWNLRMMLKHGRFRYRSPDEWLGLLQNAAYVVTNSFHATVFSTMFHKCFFSVVPKSGREGIGSRLYDYLEQLGLQDRIHLSCPPELDLTPPDYSLADAQIAQLRERSLGFLQRNLDAAWEI